MNTNSYYVILFISSNFSHELLKVCLLRDGLELVDISFFLISAAVDLQNKRYIHQVLKAVVSQIL